MAEVLELFEIPLEFLTAETPAAGGRHLAAGKYLFVVEVEKAHII